MSDFGAISRPYAEAVFSLAKDNDQISKWQDALTLIASLSENSELQSVFASPSIGEATKQSLMADLIRKASGDDEVVRFGEMLIENDRLSIANSILEQYEKLKRNIDNELNVSVESAVELEDDKIKLLSESLAKRFGKKINLTTQVNEALIGGTIIRAGDTVIDDSIRNKLSRLSSTLRK